MLKQSQSLSDLAYIPGTNLLIKIQLLKRRRKSSRLISENDHTVLCPTFSVPPIWLLRYAKIKCSPFIYIITLSPRIRKQFQLFLAQNRSQHYRFCNLCARKQQCLGPQTNTASARKRLVLRCDVQIGPQNGQSNWPTANLTVKFPVVCNQLIISVTLTLYISSNRTLKHVYNKRK
jgi:hypothetical protein